MWQNLPRDLKVLLYSTILANISTSMMQPFMPLYILALGGTVAQVGLFFTVGSLSTAVLRPLGGWFSDSIGRVQAVAIGGVFSFAGFLIYALSPNWQTLMVGTVVISGGRSIIGSSFQSFIAESAPEGQTAQTFGLVNGIFTSCRIIGPVLAGWLIARYELWSIFGVGAVFGGVAMVLRILPARGRPFAWHNVQLRELGHGLHKLAIAVGAGGLLTWLFITDSLRDMGIQSYDHLHTVLLETRGIGEPEIGTIFSFSAVIYLLVSLFGARLVDRWGPVRALAASGFLQAGALLVLVMAPERPIFWLFALLSAVALGLGDPAFDTFLAQSTSAKTLGLTFGLFSSAISILSTPMPYLGSLLWDGVWFGAPFVMGALFLTLAGVLTWVVLPKKLVSSQPVS